MKCPACGAMNTMMLARRKGWERIFSTLTGKRKLRCNQCDFVCRAGHSEGKKES